jgi:PAS domain S-box-containing protein
MQPPLRILSLEDDPRDAELLQDTLEIDGISSEITRVETEAQFVASLTRGGFDLIFADYTLPSFDGLSALKIARERLPLVPFIFVSGTLDEELAIEALKIGATDYVFKTRLSRLVPSVRRALREAAERAELRRAEEALRRSEDHFRSLVDATPALIYTARPDGFVDFLNRGWLNYLGLPLEQVCGWQWTKIFHPDDVQGCLNTWGAAIRTGQPAECEGRVRRADGEYRWMVHRKVPLRDSQGNLIKWYGASTDVDELKHALAEIKNLQDQLYKENIALREEVDKASMFEEIVGQSPALQVVLVRVAKVAPTDSTVLITGETGTGKELIARAIHKRSQRSSRAFVSVNCSAIPGTLIGSELFGHEKGSFTGALQRRLGRFELADGGTIFLDEIGELPAETQVALLRVLQEREFERVGGNQPIRADVRVIAATNRDLESAIARGSFRMDLFYRLNVFPIHMPPLRERREDIATLVEYFVHRYSRKGGKRIECVEKRTLDLLESYSWPGNIRELQNVIERSVIVSDSNSLLVDPSWLSVESPKPQDDSLLLARKPASEEKEVIEKALAASGGRVAGASGAAAHLGIPASTLESKIRSLKINKYQFKSV